MPREAKLFSSSSGSAVRVFSNFGRTSPLDGSRMRGPRVSGWNGRLCGRLWS